MDGTVGRDSFAREGSGASIKTRKCFQQVGSGGSLDCVVKDMSVRVFQAVF